MPEHAFLIRKLRKERGFTQEQLTMGISQRGTRCFRISWNKNQF